MTKEDLLHQWTDGVEPMSLTDLALIEARNGQPFPAQYRDIAAKFGMPYFDNSKVAEIEWQRHDGSAPSAEEREDMDPLIGVSTFDDVDGIATTTDLIHTYAAKGRPMVPRGMFPFSTDSAGNYLLFKGNDPQKGSVWVWYWTDDVWGQGDNVWIGFVADDFDDFLFNRLRDPRAGE
jgi:hypothetical protein